MGTTAIAIAVGKSLMLAGVSLAAVWDLTKRIIPNTLVLVAAVGGVLPRFTAGEQYAVVTSAAAAAVVFIVLRLLMNVITVGGADVKLVAAVTLGQSPHSVLSVLLSIALAGGVLSVFYLAHGWVKGGHGPDAAGTAALHREVPYAPAILGGLVLHELRGIVT